jgi:hypothetical protein
VIAARAWRAWLWRALGAVLVVALMGHRLFVLAHAPPTDFDDAYMYLRYAEHLLAGHGLAWNIGEGSVFGVTSVLHLMVVSAVRWLGGRLDAAGVLQVASGGAAVAMLAASVATAAILSRAPRLQRNWLLWAGVLLPLIALSEGFVFHAGTGMDTMLSALANAGLAFATLRLFVSATAANLALTTVTAVVAVLARPDNLPCALLGPTLALVLSARRWRSAGLYLALVVVVFGAGLGLAWIKLGAPVPLAFYAKQPHYYAGFAGEFGWNPYLFLQVFGRSVWPFVAAIILFADRPGLRRTVVLVVPAVVAMLALLRFNQIMGHLGRFDYPFLPYFVAAGALAFDDWYARAPHTSHPLVLRSLVARAALTAVVLLAGSLALSVAADAYAARAPGVEADVACDCRVTANQDLPEIDSWQAAQAIAVLAAAAPSGTRFAMSEHGLPGALAPSATIIDVLGLHDPSFARHGFSVAQLFRREPDVIWMPHPDHADMLRDILGSDELWQRYDVYPEAFFYGLALRRDGPRYPRLAQLLADAWARTYPRTRMDAYRAERTHTNRRALDLRRVYQLQPEADR